MNGIMYLEKGVWLPQVPFVELVSILDLRCMQTQIRPREGSEIGGDGTLRRKINGH